MRQNSEVNFVITSNLTKFAARFLHLHANYLASKGTTHLVIGDQRDESLNGLPVTHHYVATERQPNFPRDVITLCSLINLFLKLKPKMVLSSTPKMGILSMAAAWMLFTPCRIHIFTGQVWANQTGILRFIYKFADILICKFSTTILVDSQSQLEFLKEQKVIKNGKAVVVRKGSITGVNTKRYQSNEAKRNSLRTKLGITNDDVVILYIGRLARDKGILDLCAIFKRLSENGYSNISLCVVGHEENLRREELISVLGAAKSKTHFVDWQNDPTPYYNIADICCLPSYREG